MNSMSAGMRSPQSLAFQAELVDEDDLDVAALGVEFLHALVIGGFAAGQIGQAFAMNDGPVIVLFHPADVVAAAGGDFGAEGEQHGRLVALAKLLFQRAPARAGRATVPCWAPAG